MLGFVAFVAVSTASPTPDDAGLRRMIEATRQICSEPTTFGYTVGGVIDADAQAKIPKVLNKLIDLGLSAALKAHGEVHGGPAQKDVGSVQAARLQCASWNDGNAAQETEDVVSRWDDKREHQPTLREKR